MELTARTRHTVRVYWTNPADSSRTVRHRTFSSEASPEAAQDRALEFVAEGPRHLAFSLVHKTRTGPVRHLGPGGEPGWLLSDFVR
jgi:hypothetical protein